MKTLIIAEHNGHELKSLHYTLHTAARCFNTECDVLVIGHTIEKIANQLCCIPDVKTVWVADHANYAHQLAENTAALIAEFGKNYANILMAATTTGKNILPRVAALLDVAMVSDVIRIESHDTFVRTIYAGNALETVQSSDAIKLLTIRTSAFSPAIANQSIHAEIKTLDLLHENNHTEFVSQELTVSSRPDLASAKIIISGGRGLKSIENFKLLETLADSLGAGLGASRAAVDAGFAPNDYQVGQTGKVVAPELYLAIGISGAIQHLAGMKDSKVVIAINNDADAPIFKVADYGLVADLFTVLPLLQQELGKLLPSP